MSNFCSRAFAAFTSLLLACGGGGSQEPLDATPQHDAAQVDSAQEHDASAQPDAQITAAIQASVTYPFLLTNPTSATDYFPTEWAHLLGTTLTWTEISTRLACFTLVNSNGMAVDATVHIELTGYSTPLDQSVTVPANGTVTSCVNPTPTLSALYALSSSIPGQVHARVTQTAMTTPILDDVHAVTITTGQTSFFGKYNGSSFTNVMKYASVFSMPMNPSVQSLLAPIAARSRWGTFGVGGYQMHQGMLMNAVNSSIPNSSYTYDYAYFKSGEQVTLNLNSVTCSACTSQSINVYFADQTAFDAFAAAPCNYGGGTTYGSGQQFTLTAPSDGWHYVVFFNNCSNVSSRSVAWQRTGTATDTVTDTLRSIYDELKSRGITYVNVASNFFDPAASQTVRWPPVALSDNAANCIDGSMLFASIVEAIQLEPVVIHVQGHAFMGVRQSAGDPLVWPVETTMLGTATFDNAFATGINESNTDVHIDDVDIKEARLAGVTPIPK